MKRSLLLCAALLFAVDVPMSAGELDARMAKIVKVFTRSAEKVGLSTATLAVLPFKTDKKLAEQRVDYACGEILTNRFVEARSFKLVERAQLETVLKEQALGAGGVTESATAARVGKLLGAKLVITGNVSRLGDAYHMSTEMVDSETGEILASDITEVEAKTFDQDANRYLVLVPEYDALGLYVAGAFVTMDVKHLAPVTTSGGEVITPSNDPSSCRYFGVGARYFLSPKWMIDAAAMIGATYTGNDDIASSSLGKTYKLNNGLGGVIARIMIDRVIPASEKIKLHAAAGIVSVNEGNSGGTNAEVESKNPEVPILRAAVEWKPTPRFGLFLSGLYYIGAPTFKGKSRLQASGGVFELRTIREFSFPKFHPELNLSFYF